MKMNNIPENRNDTIHRQHLSLIHFAFGVETMQEVDANANKLAAAGFRIVSGPRRKPVMVIMNLKDLILITTAYKYALYFRIKTSSIL